MLKRKPADRHFDALTEEALAQIVAAYGLGAFEEAATMVIEGGRLVLLGEKSETSRKYVVTTSTGRYFLKEVPWYCDDPASIVFSTTVSRHANEYGVPTPLALRTGTGDPFTTLGGSRFVLFEYSAGSVYDGSGRHRSAAGAVLGRMAAAFDARPVPADSYRRESAAEVVRQHLELAGQVCAGRSDCAVDFDKLDRCLRQLVPDDTDGDVVHGDFIPWNLAFDDEGEVCAVYDFDNACLGSSLRDLGKGVVAFHVLPYAGLGTRLTPLTAQDPEIRDLDGFVRAYSREHPLTARESEALPGFATAGFVASVLMSVIRGEQPGLTADVVLDWAEWVRRTVADR